MSPKAMKMALEKLPKGSDALKLAYNSAVERVDAQKPGIKALADQILSWITITRRPLRIEELQHALAIEIDETYLDEDNFSDLEEMIGVCAGLVTIDENSKIIRFIHYTTQEYFESIRRERFNDAADNVALSCITYLMYDDLESFMRGEGQGQLKGKLSVRVQDQLVRKYPLIIYAAEHWGHHVRDGSQELLTPFALRLLRSDDHLRLCVHLSMHISTQRQSSSKAALFMAAFFGLEEAVRDLIDGGACVDCKLDGETALYAASSRGFAGVVRLLLEASADAELTGGSRGTALSAAAYYGHNEIVNMLIPRSFPWWRHGTALEQATRGGNVTTVQLLLDQGVDINSPFGTGDSLSRAVEIGNENIVSIFLNKGVTITPRVLEIAARQGHGNILRSLIQRGVGQGSVTEWIPSGIIAAASRGHKEIVKLLFELLPDADITTALVEASSNGDLDMIQFLCSLPNSSADSDVEPDLDPSFDGNSRIESLEAKFSSEAGALPFGLSTPPSSTFHADSTKLTSPSFNTIFGLSNQTWHAMLQEAVLFQQENIVKWLSKRRGGLMPKDSVVEKLSEVHNFKIVEMVWQMACGNSQNPPFYQKNYIWPAVLSKQLLYASDSGNLEFAEKVLRRGISVNTEYGMEASMLPLVHFTGDIIPPRLTPLLAAASKGHSDIVRLLLMYGAKDENGETHKHSSDAELDAVVTSLVTKWSAWWREQTRLDGRMTKRPWMSKAFDSSSQPVQGASLQQIQESVVKEEHHTSRLCISTTQET
jgi:ankyrin repeat protein